MGSMNKKNWLIWAIIGLVLVAILYTVLKPPAPKPVPEPAPSPAPEVIPDAPQPAGPEFDVTKYKQEPVVSVYRAETGGTESMPLETYLEGVIAKEMENSWPVEALAAQAITSRTLTINAIEAKTIRKLHGTDVSTNKDELQAYAPEKVNEAVKEAVRKTRGQVLLYNNSLVQAIYSSCNGQIAATKEEAFPKEITVPTPYFQPVADNSLKYAPPNIQHWKVKISGSEVAAAVGYNGNPADIQILEKGPSGRILYIGAGNKKIYGSEFRQRIGYERLKSTLITSMTYENGQFVFEGSGWGNGIGLCQWGAYGFAQEGWTAQQIVEHYYVGSHIYSLYP